METYQGRKEVYERVQKMVDGTRFGSRIRIMTTQNGIVRMYKARERTYADAIKRGVSLRVALPITKGNLWHVEQFVNMGAEVRHLPDAALTAEQPLHRSL